uniref:Satellite-like RNA n=1 Tax=Rhodosporidiobolus odoratus dsRNA Virus 1 satellite TaxID=2787046 RepID=A0A7U3SNY0_9VIRU|nr:Satellite-like RNA [Rhodosporidiobolus odoratus dsRNA Virus 1 satellite]
MRAARILDPHSLQPLRRVGGLSTLGLDPLCVTTRVCHTPGTHACLSEHLTQAEGRCNPSTLFHTGWVGPSWYTYFSLTLAGEPQWRMLLVYFNPRSTATIAKNALSTKLTTLALNSPVVSSFPSLS